MYIAVQREYNRVSHFPIGTHNLMRQVWFQHPLVWYYVYEIEKIDVLHAATNPTMMIGLWKPPVKPGGKIGGSFDRTRLASACCLWHRWKILQLTSRNRKSLRRWLADICQLNRRSWWSCVFSLLRWGSNLCQKIKDPWTGSFILAPCAWDQSILNCTLRSVRRWGLFCLSECSGVCHQLNGHLNSQVS